MSTPIIQSRLDNDFYNFTMGQLIWRHFPDVQVTYELTNRTAGVKLGRLVELQRLKAEIEHVRQLGFTTGELGFLRAQGLFSEDYLGWLAHAELPPVRVSTWQGQLRVSYTGNWAEAVFWETPLLAIVNQLANETRAEGHEAKLLAEAQQRLEVKIERLAAHSQIKFVEFGSRRRFSTVWQHEVTRRLQEALPDQIIGTSNVQLAYQLGLRPSGTMAHQLFMVTTAIARAAGSKHPIADSQAEVLGLYEEMYGHIDSGRMLAFLPDTYGTETGLGLLGAIRSATWRGLRQDSGDPFVQVQRMIDHYRWLGIDPATKTIMPSDGLNVDLMIALDAEFGSQTNLPFGVGTDLTNDTAIPPVSIVIKPVLADGEPCGKLSDNLDKATGRPDTIAALKAEVGYHATYRLQPVS